MKLGDAIRALRREWEMGTREMAKEIGISPATLNRIERGEACDSATLTKLLAWILSP